MGFTAPARRRTQDLRSWSIALAALVIALNTGATSSPSPFVMEERETTSIDKRGGSDLTLTCRLSAFMTSDHGPVTPPRLKFEGRALLTCRNGGGFTSETPLKIELEADAATLKAGLKEGRAEIAISGNSSPFTIPRDVTQIQDSYRLQSLSTTEETASGPKAILRGLKHDLLIELAFSSHTTPIEGLKIESLRLSLVDDRATRPKP